MVRKWKLQVWSCLRVWLPVHLNSSCRRKMCLILEPNFAVSQIQKVYMHLNLFQLNSQWWMTNWSLYIWWKLTFKGILYARIWWDVTIWSAKQSNLYVHFVAVLELSIIHDGIPLQMLPSCHRVLDVYIFWALQMVLFSVVADVKNELFNSTLKLVFLLHIYIKILENTQNTINFNNL